MQEIPWNSLIFTEVDKGGSRSIPVQFLVPIRPPVEVVLQSEPFRWRHPNLCREIRSREGPLHGLSHGLGFGQSEHSRGQPKYILQHHLWCLLRPWNGNEKVECGGFGMLEFEDLQWCFQPVYYSPNRGYQYFMVRVDPALTSLVAGLSGQLCTRKQLKKEASEASAMDTFLNAWWVWICPRSSLETTWLLSHLNQLGRLCILVQCWTGQPNLWPKTHGRFPGIIRIPRFGGLKDSPKFRKKTKHWISGFIHCLVLWALLCIWWDVARVVASVPHLRSISFFEPGLVSKLCSFISQKNPWNSVDASMISTGFSKCCWQTDHSKLSCPSSHAARPVRVQALSDGVLIELEAAAQACRIFDPPWDGAFFH